MAVSDRQPMLAVGSTNGTLTMFDLRKPGEPYSFEMLHEGTSAPIRDLAFTDHDNELFACVGGSLVRLQWQAKVWPEYTLRSCTPTPPCLWRTHLVQLSFQSDPDIKCVASDCMAFTRVDYSGQHAVCHGWRVMNSTRPVQSCWTANVRCISLPGHGFPDGKDRSSGTVERHAQALFA